MIPPAKSKIVCTWLARRYSEISNAEAQPAAVWVKASIRCAFAGWSPISMWIDQQIQLPVARLSKV